MSFFEALIRALIYICFMVLAFYLCIWVLGALGLAVPYMVLNVIKVILVLVAVLILFRLFSPWVTGFTLFPSRRPPAPPL